MKRFILSFGLPVLLSVFSVLHAQEKIDFSDRFSSFDIQKGVDAISYELLGGEEAEISVSSIDEHTFHVKMTFDLKEEVQQDDWQLNVTPSFSPLFSWAPHLTPTDRNIIAQHVFRSPALVTSDKEQVLIVIPDVEILNANGQAEWYMDLNAPKNELTLGMSKSKVSDHVIFERARGAAYAKGKVEYGFYLLYFEEKEQVENPFRSIASFYWEKWGHTLLKEGNPSTGSLEPYVKHAYNWAFNTWESQVWQEFSIDGKQVGAPTFIVNVTQSPNYEGEVNEREFRSVWNQAWFSSLRSAAGLYRYARRTKNEELMNRARLTKELALAFPKKEGFFYGLIETEMEQVTIDGKEYNRSKGWDSYFWGNSNRNPYTWDPKESPFHILDMSWTAYLMLTWYDELEKDERLLEYAADYADALLDVQYPNGFFPSWLDLHTLDPSDYLVQSSESSMSVTFLLKLFELTKEKKYKEAALKAMEAVMNNVIEEGKWEDFETYWSCSRVGSTYWVGNKIWRNNMYKQNNFSMFWTAQALLESYRMTQDEKYLKLGQRTLDELLMTQASWQPHFIPIKALGGFGVLNADGEWNDARQSLFSELLIQYGKTLHKEEYVERGVAAMRASFTMMYCPENPLTKEQWEKAWPFFGKEDYGFMMENYGHDGKADAEGLGIGEFTIYDWGNGAAAEAYNRIVDHYGEEFLISNGKEE